MQSFHEPEWEALEGEGRRGIGRARERAHEGEGREASFAVTLAHRLSSFWCLQAGCLLSLVSFVAFPSSLLLVVSTTPQIDSICFTAS